LPDSQESLVNRLKVPSGYGELDDLLGGGFLAASAILLSAPTSSKVPILLRGFVKATDDVALLILPSLFSAETILPNDDDSVQRMICSETPFLPGKGFVGGVSLESLTQLSIRISQAADEVKAKRVVLGILSDVLLQHKALQTRRWLNAVLEKLKARGITTLATINPYMFRGEEVQGIVDQFDGVLEISEKDIEGSPRQLLRVKWMHGITAAETGLELDSMTESPRQPTEQPTIPVPAFIEPRWETPLISRKEQLSRLEHLFDSPQTNTPCVVALHGELGVGKSRLMQELAVYAHSKGATVLTARAIENGLSYSPWVSVAKQCVSSATPEALRRVFGTNAYELVKLVPDLAPKLGSLQRRTFLGQETEKTRFYETVSQLLVTISHERPLLLLFDDMQYADQASLDLLEYFIRNRGTLQLLTICSSSQAAESVPLNQFLLKMSKEHLLETIEVSNLGKEETIELTKQLLGQEKIPGEFTELLYKRTAGNPYFVEEALRSLIEDGVISGTEESRDFKKVQHITMPATIRSMLKSKLARFDSSTISILEWAAVIGTVFDFEVLKEVSQLGEDALLKELETAIRGGLLIEVPEQANRFEFSDPLIREILLDDLIQLKRKRYHLKIAEAMEKTYGNSLVNQAELIASQYSEAQDKERALKYSILAGDRNKSIHAYQRSIENYSSALKLIQERGSAEKAAILEKLAATYSLSGQVERCIESYEQALSLLEELGDVRSCARIIPELSLAVRTARGIPEAIEVARKGLSYIKGNPESYEAASIDSTLGRWLSVLDKREEGNKWMEMALQVGEKTTNYAAVSEALLHLGGYLADTGQIDEGLLRMKKGLELAVQQDLYDQTRNGLINLAIYTYPRSLVEARDFATRLFNLGKRENDVSEQATALALLAVLDWMSGEWPLALEESKKAFEMQNRLRFIFKFTAEAWIARLHLDLGDLEEAERLLKAALAEKSSKIAVTVAAHLGLGLLRLKEGRIDEAKSHLETCFTTFSDAEFDSLPVFYIETLLQLTAIYISEGRLDEAYELGTRARRIAEVLGSQAGLAMAWQAEARVQIARGNLMGGQQAYLRSLTLWDKADWPHYHADALVAYADTIAQTKAQESRMLMEQASQIFLKLGAVRDSEETERKLSLLPESRQ